MRTAGLDTSARVTGLHPNTKYHVTVQAYNRAGTGPASPSDSIQTMKSRESVTLIVMGDPSGAWGPCGSRDGTWGSHL